ncbi:MAG: heat-inducible transcriptional repressor HrcA [candidate division Zixibacteria bacterium]|nr:heat-inducible transcriptional repressor HrcA [candidate division Zixibacteria bacterium]
MSFSNLTDREKEILQSLIEHYIATAEPVGSRVIANKYKMGLSPATIRNTLQDLEEMGLVNQPHTSAGRVPTDKGYRIYVDSLLEPEGLTLSERERIEKEITLDYAAVEDLLEQTSHILGIVSKQLGVTIAPRFDQGILTRIDLIPVAEKKILVVLAVKSGLVRSILLEADSPLEGSDLEETKRLLNERLCGLSLGTIRESADQRVGDISSGNPKLVKLFLDSKDSIFSSVEFDQVHLGGTTNILSQPEFKNYDKLKPLISLIEEKKLLAQLFATKGIKEGITVTIGKEIERGEMESCSLVTSRYEAGELGGIIGIIGPTRMRYSKLVSLVDYTAKLLSRILSK